MRFPAIMFRPAVLPPFDPSWKQHCRSCTHCSQTIGDEGRSGLGHTIMRCARSDEFCIYAREAGGTCGPGASGWLA